VNDMRSLYPGAIVSINYLGGIEHVGIVSDRFHKGYPMIISASRRTGVVAEERLEDFSDGKEIRVKGFPGSFSVRQVLVRARSMIGTKYNLLKWNCEHFVHWAHGMKVESKQLHRAVMVFGLLAVMYVLIRKR